MIHINLAKCDSSSPEKLEAWLKYTLRKIAKSYDIEPESDYASIMFESLIDQLVEKTGKKVVLLLDEYDKPLTDNIRNGKIEAIRTELEGFYSVIKGEEENLRFTFITGITKFSQVSIFSKLNNLTDISRDKKYAEMFGYTEDELLQYFGEYIEEALASDVKDTEGISLDRKGLLDRLKSQYDGFAFSLEQRLCIILYLLENFLMKDVFLRIIGMIPQRLLSLLNWQEKSRFILVIPPI